MNQEGRKVMQERFGKDSLIALATTNGDYPAVRYVDAYYEDGAFYIITYLLSNKMQQIAKNNNVSVCGEWMTAKGKAENLGYFGKEANKEMAEKLRQAFAAWIDNGHNNFEDENTIILKIQLEEAVVFCDGKRYEIDYKLEK